MRPRPATEANPHLVDVWWVRCGDVVGLTIEVGEPLTPWGQELMDTLGVTVVVTPGAPTKPAPGLFVDTHAKRFRGGR